MPEYTFSVTARDRGYPAQSSKVTVKVTVLDVNDNVPIFDQTQYSATLYEGSPVNSLVVLPSVSDMDRGNNSNLTFTLTSPRGGHSFYRIDPINGAVTLAEKLNLAELQEEGIVEEDSTMTLTVTATDQGDPPKSAEVSLVIYIEHVETTNQLVFVNRTYNISLLERTASGSMVLLLDLVYVPPLARLTYTVLGTDYFTFSNQRLGELVTTDVLLDYEDQSHLMFTVQVTDSRSVHLSAYAMVTVYVEDINDNPPVFEDTHYTFHVTEGLYTRPHFLGRVLATDADSGRNGRVVYSSSDNHFTDGPFHIESDTGRLTVQGLLDREIYQVHSFHIQAADNGPYPFFSTALVDVVVDDINDQQPAFDRSHYDVNVTESTLIGQQILEVQAHDEDAGLNGTVFYKIDYNISRLLPFYVKNRDGRALVCLSAQLQYEEESHFDLKVIAYDLGTPSLTAALDVRINVLNDKDLAPHFDLDVYTVKVTAELSVGTVVFVCQAGQGHYTYSIISGNDEGLFHLDPQTGELTVKDHLPADTQILYDLTLFVQDHLIPPNTDTARLLIRSVPSSAVPVFPERWIQATLPENIPGPTLVVDLDTLDEEAGKAVEYSWEDNPYRDLFTMEPHTGRIWCNDVLDRETVDRYVFVVHCDTVHKKLSNRTRRDTGVTNVAEVEVLVSDVNDNPPEFLRNPIILGVGRDATFNSLVGKIKATDRDIGNNSALVYSIIGGQDVDKFHIESSEGLLYTKVKVMTSDLQMFGIVVKATDQWGAGLSANTLIQIHVLDRDNTVVLNADLPPEVFKQNIQTIVSNLSSILGFEVKAQKVEPHLSEVNGQLTVDVARADLYFYAVDNKNGNIVLKDTVLRKLDRYSEEVQRLFQQFGITGVTSVLYQAQVSTHIGATEGALIALGGMVIVGSIIGVICVCVTWKQNKKEKKTGGKSRGQKKGQPFPNQGGLPNPAFHSSANEIYSTPDIDSGNILDSTFKPMETQRLSIYLPEEGHGSDLSSPSQATSFGAGSGETAVVMETPPGSLTEGNESKPHDSWESAERVRQVRDRRNRTLKNFHQRERTSSSSSGYSSNDNKLMSLETGVNQETGSSVERSLTLTLTPASPGVVLRKQQLHKELLHAVCESKTEDHGETTPPPCGRSQKNRQKNLDCKGEDSFLLPGAALYQQSDCSTLPSGDVSDVGRGHLQSDPESAAQISDVVSVHGSDTQGVFTGVACAISTPAPPLATVYPYSATSSNIFSKKIAPITSQGSGIKVAKSKMLQTHYKKNNNISKTRNLFATIHNRIPSAKLISRILRDPNKAIFRTFPCHGMNTRKPRKGRKFMKVSPVVNSMKLCMSSKQHSKTFHPSVLEDKPIVIGNEQSLNSEYSKKKSWTGRGRIVTFGDCLNTVKSGKQSLHEQHSEGKTHSFVDVFPCDFLPYEEAETKF